MLSKAKRRTNLGYSYRMLAKIEINYPKTSLGLGKDRQHLSEEWIFPKAKYVSWIRGQQGCGLRKVLIYRSGGELSLLKVS